MKKIVIASACRTAIGKFGGTLANVPAAELGSIVIKEALNRANVKPEQVDHVYMGCVIQAGLGQNVARQASLKAGLPIETPAVTVNVVCGSGLNCVNMAAQMIEAGDADIVVAGGMENMDMAPFAMMKGRYGYRMGYPMGKSELVDTMVNDALWDATGCNMHMGIPCPALRAVFRESIETIPPRMSAPTKPTRRSTATAPSPVRCWMSSLIILRRRQPRLSLTALSRMRSFPLSSRARRVTPCLIPMKAPA